MEFENSWVNNYSRAAYIDVGFMEFPQYEEQVKREAEGKGWEYKKLPGDARLIRKLIDGEWDEDEFLMVQPGEEIIASYDDCIIRCRSLHDTANVG